MSKNPKPKKREEQRTRHGVRVARFRIEQIDIAVEVADAEDVFAMEKEAGALALEIAAGKPDAEWRLLDFDDEFQAWVLAALDECYVEADDRMSAALDRLSETRQFLILEGDVEWLDAHVCWQPWFNNEHPGEMERELIDLWVRELRTVVPSTEDG